MAKATTRKTGTRSTTASKSTSTRSRSTSTSRTTKSTASKSTAAKASAPTSAAAASKESETTAAAPSTSRLAGDAAVESAVSAAPSPTVVTEVKPVVQGREMKKKELIDAVVTRSGIKKKDAKPVVEAMMAVLGEALSEGRMLNLQPLGKIKVNRTKELSGSRVLRCQIRQTTDGGSGDDKDPLADAAE